MLSPNALRDLNRLGMYSEARKNGYSFERLHFYEDHSTELREVYYFGREAIYGYSGLHIYCRVLVEIMLQMLRERAITVHY